MIPRLTTRLFVNALMRRAQAEGGAVTILSHGDDSAGGLILICTEKGGIRAILERSHDMDGRMIWRPSPTQTIENYQKTQEYLTRRCDQDADLWLVELDIPCAERFAADFIAAP